MPYAAESFERLFNSMNNATNTYVGIYDKQKETQAKFDLSNMQIILERQANDTLSELQKNNNYENWEADMDKFFNNIAGNLENKDSPYYVKNNYTARAAQTMLENARNDYQAKVKQLADVKIRQLNISRYNESLETLSTLYSGQELIDQRNNLSKMLYENGDISPEQYSSEIEKNWYIGTMTNYTSNFSDDLVNKAIADGKDFNETWDEYERSLEKTKRYGVDGLEILTNDKDIKEKAKQECSQKFASALYSMQTKNEQWHNNLLTDIDTDFSQLLQGNLENIQATINKLNLGLATVERQTGNQLPKGENLDIAKKYRSYLSTLTDLMDAERTGDSKKVGQAVAKLPVDNLMDYYIDAFRRGSGSFQGGTESAYEARDMFKQELLEQFRAIEGENATWEDLTKQYPKANDFIDVCRKNLPPAAQTVMDTIETVIKTTLADAKDSPYYDMVIGMAMDEAFDMVCDLSISDLDGPEIDRIVKGYSTQAAAIYGGILDNKRKYKMFGETIKSGSVLFDYKEGMNQDKIIAAALTELQNNPHYVYTDQHGNTRYMGDTKLKNGMLSLENNLKKIIADTIGGDVDPKEIKMEHEADGANDLKSTMRFTYKGKDYRFVADDEKNYHMEVKINGKDKNGNPYPWNKVNTKKEQAAIDKKTEKSLQPENLAYSTVRTKDISSAPPVPGNVKLLLTGGYYAPVTKDSWKNATEQQKQEVIRKYLIEDPEAAQNWIDSLEDKQKAFNPIQAAKNSMK